MSEKKKYPKKTDSCRWIVQKENLLRNIAMKIIGEHWEKENGWKYLRKCCIVFDVSRHTFLLAQKCHHWIHSMTWLFSWYFLCHLNEQKIKSKLRENIKKQEAFREHRYLHACDLWQVRLNLWQCPERLAYLI